MSSTYLLQKQGGMWKEDRALHSMSSITRLATTTTPGDLLEIMAKRLYVHASGTIMLKHRVG